MTENTSVMLAIDLGGTSVKMALYSFDCAEDDAGAAGAGSAGAGASGAAGDSGTRAGAVPGMPQCLGRKSIPTRTENGGVSILADIAEAAEQLVSEKWLSLPQLAGIGIGVPGPVITTPDGHEIVNGCVNLNWKGQVDVIRELGDLTGAKRITLLNDANAAALGEFYFGEAETASDHDEGGDCDGAGGYDGAGSCDEGGGCDGAGGHSPAGSACMVTLGTGIGGGIIQGGRIITGAFGAAGEIGHMPVEPAGKLIDLLRENGIVLREDADLEYFASATGIARFARLALQVSDAESALRGIPEESLEAKDVFDAAKADDALACLVTEFYFDMLGRGLASITSVIDPDLYIIGGGVSAAGDFLLDGICDAYRSCVFKPSLKTRFRLASLGNDAGLLGAIVPLLG